MAQLGDLPPELILAIFSHLRLGLPMHDLFVWTGDIDEQGRITGVKWNDLLNFSLLNRHFRQIVSDKLYTQIRIQGKLPITRLVSLLRFVTAHPDAAADVRQVYINLDPGRTGSASLRQNDTYLIQTAAENSGITYPQEIFPCEDQAADHLAKSLIDLRNPGCQEEEHLRLQVLVAILLAHLRGTQELALTCPYGIFRNFARGNLAKQRGSGFDPDDERVRFADETPMIVGKPWLPQLFSLVTTHIAGTEPFRTIGFEGDELANLLCLGSKTSRLCLDDAGVDFRLQKGPVGNWANISHLTLTTQHISIAAMQSIANHCSALSTFKYLPTACESFGVTQSTQAEPGEVIHALRKHANTLRTLCISSSGYSPRGFLSMPVSKLDCFVALENLWIDNRTITGDLPAVQGTLIRVDRREKLIMSLPPSIKRLHLHNASYVPSGGLYWLAGHTELFPNLVRVELDWPTGDDYTPEEVIRKLFLQVGVDAPTRRGMIRDARLWDRYF
ncbi:hypothetical protein CCHR01_14182 [Colletotrichum chrysophilum]|uniref:Uncharacterized protein n=1 Tax=Colletotrichum chrysophilum TaxID=1836956 RepID=A0AAD9A824_9PEZI|nr:hypothetical protein CCHR01_14182 [Colletotrichum chrysophilum]